MTLRAEVGRVVWAQADLLRVEGRLGEADAALDEAEVALGRAGERMELCAVWCVRGHVRLARGDAGGARAALEAAEALSGDASATGISAHRIATLRRALDVTR